MAVSRMVTVIHKKIQIDAIFLSWESFPRGWPQINKTQWETLLVPVKVFWISSTSNQVPGIWPQEFFSIEESTDKAQDSMNWLGTQVMHVLPVGNNQVFYSQDLNTIHKTWSDSSTDLLPTPTGNQGLSCPYFGSIGTQGQG